LLRIAMISELFMPYVKGGVERRYWEIARRLAKRHEVHEFTMRLPGTPAEEVIEGVSVHRTGYVDRLYDTSGRRRIRPALEFARGLFRRLGQERRRFDVVDCSAFPLFTLLPSEELLKETGSPTDHHLSRGLVGILARVPRKLCYGPSRQNH
jgi:glycosyltransferase involved in cell wall biosynthesis